MNDEFANTSTPTNGWTSFYSNLQAQGNVPNASNSTITGDNAVFRGNVLDVADIQAQISTAGLSPLITTIYTDILQISTLAAWAVNGAGLVIYARRIEVNSGCSLNVTLGASANINEAELMIFCAEIDGVITANEITINESNIVPGIGISYSGSATTSTALTLQQGFPITITEDQRAYFCNSFLFGALCYDQNPEIALSILLWVQGWAGASNNPDLYQLYFRSTSLSSLLGSQIIAEQNGTTYVPHLSSDVYQQLASAMGAELVNDETNYIQLFTAETVTEDMITQATTLAQNSTNQVSYVKKLLTQANANYSNANDAVNIAQLNFSNQQDVVTTVGNNLQDVGIPAYKEKVIVEAVFDIAKAIVEFGVGIAGMMTGNEETAPAAAEGAVAAAEAVETGATIADTMKSLKKLVEVLQQLYTLSQALYAAGSAINAAGSPADQFNSIQKANSQTGSADVNGLAAWSVFQIQADDNIQPLIDNSIEYASDYKEALDMLAVYGQALCAAQIAAIKASQQCTALNFQLYYATQNANDMAAEVKTLTVNQAPILKLQQLFYQKYLDAKTSLFSILKNYQATYYYWALQPSSVNPSLIDLAAEITSPLNDMTAMSFDQYNALISFGGGPQTMSSVLVTITDPSVIADLQNGKTAQWVLPLDEPAFSGFERVRLTTARIWLDGEGLYNNEQSTTVNLTIKTSGNYQDQFNGNEYWFNSAPLDLGFEYTVSNNISSHPLKNNLYAAINVDGSSAPGFGNDYFEPTPFSEWRVTLPTKEPSGMDYSKITSVIMEFIGSVIEDN